MGRIPKSKIEQIQNLLRKGYLKKEAAKEVGVHVRTVSKYDPNHKSKSVTSHSMKRQLEDVRELARTLLDWVQFLHFSITADTLECPRCGENSLRRTELDSDVFYLCVNCRYRLIWPWEVCHQCLSQGKMNYDYETQKSTCPECGNRQN